MLALILAGLGALVSAQAEAAPRRKRTSSAAPERSGPAQERAQRLGLGNVKAAGQLLAGRVDPSWVRAIGQARMPPTLRFPVAKGWFVRGFGSGKGGYHQAMDIGGLVGWNVRAAGPAIVGYAGNEISGYGNMVILIHPGGLITTYAHNSNNRVVAGQRIERGAVIAELGSTGKSKGPHVHFELLFNGQNCDPGPLFRPDVRRKNGAIVPILRSLWQPPKRRPKAIKCHPRKHHPDRDNKHDPGEIEELGGDGAADVSADTSPSPRGH